MTLEQLLLNKFKQLPINKQQELLNFADFLSKKSINQ